MWCCRLRRRLGRGFAQADRGSAGLHGRDDGWRFGCGGSRFHDVLQRSQNFLGFFFHRHDVFVMQLPTNFVGADFTLNFLFDRIEAALQAPNPQPRCARGTGQTLGAEHQKGDEANEQQFTEADTEH